MDAWVGFVLGAIALVAAGAALGVFALRRLLVSAPAGAALGGHGVLGPVQEGLRRMEARLGELETSRAAAHGALSEQVEQTRAAAEFVGRETAALTHALRAPQARGRWGELQLRRVVELAGMSAHCDFAEQVSVRTEGGTLRPDLVVHLTGGRNVVVDAKVSLAAYLQAHAAAEESVATERLRAHAKHLRAHVDQLAGKAYWRHVAGSPEFVVLFLPGEAFLAPALEHDPELLEHAIAARVLIATPSSLVAMLRTIAWNHQQEALSLHAQEVFDLGRELYTRLATAAEHVDRLGRSLSRTVSDFNAAAASMESRVLVSARRLNALGIATGEIPSPRAVENAPRPLAAPEWSAAPPTMEP
ncbi:MAG: DNA recombination protein RmuC [Sporichthyaceae bacterium]